MKPLFASLLAASALTFSACADSPVPPAPARTLPPAPSVTPGLPPVPTPPAVSPAAGNPLSVANHPLVWDSMEKTYKAKDGEATALFVFSATNTSPQDVIVDRVFPSCGCTTPQLPTMPWKLVPGANGELKASVDIKGKSGNLTKTMTVSSTAGQQLLVMKIEIPKSAAMREQERQSNMAVAHADRQLVFRGACAECHVNKGEGKLGEELFVADCAICHNPPEGHRNEMVPDLAALKVPMTEESWRNVIVNGGKPGTLMPAFAKDKGGPLTAEQVESLVKYAVKKFPFDPAKAKATLPTPAPAPAK